MNPLVVLNLGKGDCQSGLPIITAQLWLQQSTVPVKFGGSLPPAPHLPLLYHRWRALYQALYERLSWRRGGADSIEFDSDAVTHVSKAEFLRLSQQLQADINHWLNSAGFRNIDQQLRTQLAPTEAIRLIIETDDPLLQKLPWLLWRFFDHYANAEVALSAQEYERVAPTPQKADRPLQILVVLGHSNGIDIQADRTMLEQLPGAETTILTEPSRPELDRWLWRQSGWDILFFAGHSTSHPADDTGLIFLNPTEQLSIAQLKNALKAAIARGLKLAIFNSCDGSALARALADLSLPQLIVMREPIPDLVAQAFLQNFLQVFSSGEAFYPAVRQAREQLQGLEGEFPCASWLPMIYQNPTETPMVWPSLAASAEPSPSELAERRLPPNRQRINLRTWLAASAAMTLLIMGGRSFGWLQSLEMLAYDHLLRTRPPASEEAIDPRLLVVEITAQDTDQYGYPIKDIVLAAALDNLQQHQPRAIGVDLHRFQANHPGRQLLLDHFQQFPNLITVCSFGRADRTIFGHPPEFSPQQARQQVGFSDLETDQDLDGRPVVRRQLLSYDPEQLSGASNCTTPYSFSLHLALRFLQAQAVRPLDYNQDHNWQLGPVVFERLAAKTGGYQHLDGQSNQILLNYRFTPKPAKRLSLKEILTGEIQAALIRNRIVLIGVTDPIGNDVLDTPFGPLPGVWIHTHSLSHLLSAILDNRPLISVLPQSGSLQWGDALWVWVWALLGGLLGCRCRSRFSLTLAYALSALALYQICVSAFFLIALWLPLIPALLALSGTVSCLAATSSARTLFLRYPLTTNNQSLMTNDQ